LRGELPAQAQKRLRRAIRDGGLERSDKNAHQQSFRAEADLRAEARASGAAPSTAVEHVQRFGAKRQKKRMQAAP